MRRWYFSACVLIALLAKPAVTQSTPHIRKLLSIPPQIEAHPEGLDPQSIAEFGGIAQSATIAEVRRALPALVSLTESPNEKIRGIALFVLWEISARNKPGLPENRREMDLTGCETMVFYIPRLAPRLMDPTNPSRPMSHLLFQCFAFIRPTPPELIKAALAALNSPQSTQPMLDPTHESVGLSGTSPGPQMLWILLPAAADFHRDPLTNITVGHDSVEVQEAIIQFLHRPDQTAESISESIRALELAQVKDPAVHAALLPQLDSPEVSVQTAMLQHIAALTLSPEDVAAARASVMTLAANPKTPADVRQIANSILPHLASSSR